MMNGDADSDEVIDHVVEGNRSDLPDPLDPITDAAGQDRDADDGDDESWPVLDLRAEVALQRQRIQQLTDRSREQISHPPKSERRKGDRRRVRETYKIETFDPETTRVGDVSMESGVVADDKDGVSRNDSSTVTEADGQGARSRSQVAATSALTPAQSRVRNSGGESASDSSETPVGSSEPEKPSGSGPTSVGPPLTVSREVSATTSTYQQDREAMLPQESKRRGFFSGALLLVAVALAVVSGVLGALLLNARSQADELRAELIAAEESATQAASEVASTGDLVDDLRTLELENERLEQQIADMSALVNELPAGRVSEIDVPFVPVFADEENGRLIAIDETGAYVVWGEGADGPITDSGQAGGPPTGLFASRRKAWISTELNQVEIVTLANEDGNPTVEYGPTRFLVAEELGYWTYNSERQEIARLRKSDGGVTETVSVPTDVVDMTIGAGSVWALGDDGRVHRLNTADFTLQPIEAGESLISISAGPDSLWTLSAADGALRRVDPVTGEVLVTVPVGRDPIDAVFAGNSVWVALRSGASLIEVDTRTSAVVSRTTLPSTPVALHRGDSGVFVAMDAEVPLVRVSSLVAPVDVDAGEAEDIDIADG